MKVYKLSLTIPESREVKVQLPEDFPPGPADVIVLSALAGEAPSEKAQEAMLRTIQELRQFRPTLEERRFLEDLDEHRMRQGEMA